MVICVRMLERLCRKLSMYRRIKQTNLEDMVAFLQTKIAGNGQNQGYQWLNWCAIQRGYVVSQDTIGQLMKLLDPEGVEGVEQRRVQRHCHSKAPNVLWHMDGYNKLKPFGIAISGCIDGFRHYFVWTEAYTTNNNPKVIADDYVSSTALLGGCLERLRADRGTVSADRGGTNFILMLTLFSKCRDLSQHDISCYFILEILRFKKTFWH